MSVGKWKKLYSEMEIDSNANKAPKPTMKDCADAEEKLKITLPKSYKTFITVFGAGELAQEFKIFAPNCSNKRFDLVSVNRKLRKNLLKNNSLEHYHEDPAQCLRLVFFAHNCSGDDFGWDPEQITSSKNSEYKVYLLPRVMETNEYYTDTFEAFILELCLGDLYTQYRNVESWDLDGERKSFERARK